MKVGSSFTSWPNISYLKKTELTWFFILFIPCIFLQSNHQPTYALNKIHSEAIIKFLHVSIPGCHHQGDIQNKGVIKPTANQALCLPSKNG
jgi:hypothetical protein